MSEETTPLPVEPEENLLEIWPDLSEPEREAAFRILPRVDAEDLFLEVGAREQAEIIRFVLPGERQGWIRLLAPDDAADVIQQFPKEEHGELIALLDRVTRKEVSALLAYDEDEAGGLMSPRFARLRPDMHVDEAISYLRRQARRQVETITYAYVLDEEQHLLGVISLRELFIAEPSKMVRDIMIHEIVSVPDTTNQEEVARMLKQNDLYAIPVVDEDGRIQGIVTVDDVMDVVEEEVTKDIQKIGGMQALDAPYIDTGFVQMIRRRAGWLCTLFVSEMLTTTAMSRYEQEISNAVVLALFIPLIISAGGNSGSQASTLIVRSLALGEVKIRAWWKVLIREFAAGICLGTILGLLGLARILLIAPPGVQEAHLLLLAITISLSVVFVVMWGTVAGSMLPIVLSRFKLDPASASAPFVATLVDVTGVIIYFTVAKWMLTGTVM